MKKLTLCIVGVVVLLAGCAGEGEVYTERGDFANNSPLGAERIGTLRPLVIKGSISSAGDMDYYQADAGSATVLRYEVFENGKSQITAGGVSDFPFAIWTCDAAGQHLTEQNYAAGLGSHDLKPGTEAVWFLFQADQQHMSGAYELHLE